MPEEIKAIVRKLLAEKAQLNTSWENLLGWIGEEDFDTLFEWLKAEAEKE